MCYFLCLTELAGKRMCMRVVCGCGFWACWPLSRPRSGRVGCHAGTAPVIGHSAAYSFNQFRIDWKAKAFWMLFRSDEVANCTVDGTSLFRRPDDSGRVKYGVFVRPCVISCPVYITSPTGCWNVIGTPCIISNLICFLGCCPNSPRDALHCVLLLDAKSYTVSANPSEKISSIIGYVPPYERDQFRVYWYKYPLQYYFIKLR